MIGNYRRKEIVEQAEQRLPNLICPFCGKSMVRGTSRVENAIFDLLLLPGSSMALFFRTLGRRRVPVLSRSNPRDAFLCEDCGTMTIVGQRASVECCRACGADIRPGSSVCTSCGKSFDPAAQPVEY